VTDVVDVIVVGAGPTGEHLAGRCALQADGLQQDERNRDE
jgi:flavin-dependent dehydrogenase